MANKLYSETDVKAVADAIRTKNLQSASDKYTIAEMDIKVLQLPSMRIYERYLPYGAEKAAQSAAVAQTYIDNANQLIYKAGNYGAFHDVVFDESGRGYIDCSTFVGLVLRGIPFEKSPYNGYESTARTDLYPWADKYLDANNIRWANELAEYFFKSGRAFTNPEDLMPGDVAFHAKKTGDNSYFANIWHVSYCMENKGAKMSHSLYGGAAVRTYAAGDADSEDWLFFGRPDYAADYTVSETEEDQEENAVLKILEQPTDQSGAAGETAVFTVKAQGVGLTYQWYYRTGSASDWYQSTFAGYDTDTQPVEIQSWRNGHQYRCVITDAYGNTVTSDYGTIIMAS